MGKWSLSNVIVLFRISSDSFSIKLNLLVLLERSVGSFWFVVKYWRCFMGATLSPLFLTEPVLPLQSWRCAAWPSSSAGRLNTGKTRLMDEWTSVHRSSGFDLLGGFSPIQQHLRLHAEDLQGGRSVRILRVSPTPPERSSQGPRPPSVWAVSVCPQRFRPTRPGGGPVPVGVQPPGSLHQHLRCGRRRTFVPFLQGRRWSRSQIKVKVTTGSLVTSLPVAVQPGVGGEELHQVRDGSKSPPPVTRLPHAPPVFTPFMFFRSRWASWRTRSRWSPTWWPSTTAGESSPPVLTVVPAEPGGSFEARF